MSLLVEFLPVLVSSAIAGLVWSVVLCTATTMDHRARRDLRKAMRAQPCDTLLITPDEEHALMVQRRRVLCLVQVWTIDRLPTAAWDAAVGDLNCGQGQSTVDMTRFRVVGRLLTMAQTPVAVAPDAHGNLDWLPPAIHRNRGRLHRATGLARTYHFYARTGVLRANPNDIAVLISQLRSAEPQPRAEPDD